LYPCDQAYSDEEAAATAAKKGVWRGKNFQKPWEYRKAKKAEGAANAQSKRDAAAAKAALQRAPTAPNAGDDEDATLED